MKRIAPIARKRSLSGSRKGERAEWLRLSPEERWQAVEEMRLVWCRAQDPPCELGRVEPVVSMRALVNSGGGSGHSKTQNQRQRIKPEGKSLASKKEL